MAYFDQITASVPDTRDVLGLRSPTTVYALIAQGKVDTIALGGKRLILTASVKRLIEELSAEAPRDLRRSPTLPARYPAKNLLAAAVEHPAAVAPVKRGRGRPRKNPLPLDAG
jgi:hypothetical protein